MCHVERFDLKDHMVRKHKFDKEQAQGVKSQMNAYKKRKCQSDDERKSKKRIYQRKSCPVKGCRKVMYYIFAQLLYKQLYSKRI